MDQTEFKKFAGIFIAGNLLLLLPFRTGSLVAMVVISAFAALIYLDKTQLKIAANEANENLNNFSRKVIYFPILLILIRNLMYPLDQFFLTALYGGISYLICFVLAPRSKDNDVVFIIGSIFGMLAASTFGSALLDNLSIFEPISYLFVGAIIAGYQYFIGRYNGEEKSIHYGLGACTLVIAAIMQSLSAYNLAADISILVLGITTLMLGNQIKHKSTLNAGIVIFLIGIFSHWELAVRFYENNATGALATSGLLLLVGVSVFEKFFPRIKAKFIGVKKEDKLVEKID